MRRACTRAVSPSAPRSSSARRVASSGASGPTGSSRTSAAGSSSSARKLAQKGAVGVLAAVAGDEQQRRRVGRTQDRAEQRRRVDVAPLQIVDGEHQRPAIGDARQQLAQRVEGAPPELDADRASRRGAAAPPPPPRPAAAPGTGAPAPARRAARAPRPRASTGAPRCWLTASMSAVDAPCTARSRARSSGPRARARPTPRGDRGSGAPSSSCPCPTQPCTKVTTVRPRRVAANASASAPRCASRPTSACSAADEVPLEVWRTTAAEPRRRSTSRALGRASRIAAQQLDAQARRDPAARRARAGAAARLVLLLVHRARSFAAPTKGSRPVSAS